MNGKVGGIQPHRRHSSPAYEAHRQRVAEKLAEIDDFLKPEKQAERRRQRSIEYKRERRKWLRLWG